MDLDQTLRGGVQWQAVVHGLVLRTEGHSQRTGMAGSTNGPWMKRAPQGAMGSHADFAV